MGWEGLDGGGGCFRGGESFTCLSLHMSLAPPPPPGSSNTMYRQYRQYAHKERTRYAYYTDYAYASKAYYAYSA